VVRAILLLKFEQIEPLGACFADRLAEITSAEGDAIAADVVVPVPLHRERELERGYNQQLCSPGHWQEGCACRIKRYCWCVRERAQTRKCSVWRSPGSLCMALLPHVQAAKLTI